MRNAIRTHRYPTWQEMVHIKEAMTENDSSSDPTLEQIVHHVVKVNRHPSIPFDIAGKVLDRGFIAEKQVSKGGAVRYVSPERTIDNGDGPMAERPLKRRLKAPLGIIRRAYTMSREGVPPIDDLSRKEIEALQWVQSRTDGMQL